MSDSHSIEWSVFTKPWKTLSLGELGAYVKGLGFDGIELPVRPGYQVEPENVGRDLPKAAKELAGAGIKIHSIAGNTDEATIAACGAAGVPIIRTMGRMPRDQKYLEMEAKLQAEYEALVPALDKAGVTIGVQNHCDDFVTSAIGLRHLMERFDRTHIAAVWDVAHCALNGEDPELAVDIVWDHLCLVNFKNAFWRLRTGPEAERAEWQHYWTTGRQGLAPWHRAAKALRGRGYRGAICLTAEYSDEASLERLLREDIAYAKGLFAG
jgi:sugar phosphate isomerase/epimerase